MIVLQIHSGLGNQLFMYAAARALSEKRRADLYLDVDTDCMLGVNHGQGVGHSFQLDRFRIKARLLDRAPVLSGAALSSAGAISTIKARLRKVAVLRKAVRLLRENGIDLVNAATEAVVNDTRLYREKYGDWGYKPEFFELEDNTILRGCFFSFRYFDWMEEDIRRELSLKAPLSPQSAILERRIDATNSVSIHFRRGDVITNPEYRSWYEGVVTESYYRNAIEYIRARLDNPHFYIFSDDIDWVRHHFGINGEVTYVDHNGPERGYEDLHLMSRCRHNVTAGFSSFSWWAAYLNRNPGKIVVRTRRMNALPHLDHPHDFFPAGWIAVDS
ncbi:MAG TPA: alpha-1,2-fucosyltransferase [Noviherbaspirillum sp.]|uniref:alpha-1,2-fucosyltransferase n=1 Tax=Noviherbaspirillum sp. TaxID=1926288 RepID=UPI002D723092|nr:alpha-1,2-fucosyltransferase [Noviherbaspirillum sp.]HYD95991.1 alpha-1,2-fucosyltransferase [Noviherbaspirillum sp.]